MYFTSDNHFFHGIMFHHFHNDGIHTKGQGSIDQDDLLKLINFIGRKNILDADIFLEKFKNNTLKNNEVCLTFDDAIKCQIDIALPILEELKIKSFFFVYTSIFEGKPDNLEIFRYFRNNFFNHVDEFYNDFYKVLDQNLNYFFHKNKNEIKNRKLKFPFYSIEDIKFRLVRNIFLTKSQYEITIFKMFEKKQFEYKNLYKSLFFEKDDLKMIDKLGHVVGLHSHNHPTLLEKLKYDEQKNEYSKNLSIISNILDKPKNSISSMSHPCGSYNQDTLDILTELGIEIGFKNLMVIEKEKNMKNTNNSSLEISRINHANIINLI